LEGGVVMDEIDKIISESLINYSLDTGNIELFNKITNNIKLRAYNESCVEGYDYELNAELSEFIVCGIIGISFLITNCGEVARSELSLRTGETIEFVLIHNENKIKFSGEVASVGFKSLDIEVDKKYLCIVKDLAEIYGKNVTLMFK
jgi:hypothetical protein